LVEFDDTFQLYMTSELRNPEFPPYIQLMVSLINFDVTLEGLESQMLSIVVSKEKAKLEEDRLQQSKEAVALIKELKELNQQILDSLSCSVEEMLEDQNMIDTLHTSREKAEVVANNLNKVNKTTQKIEKAKAFYNPAAYRAAIMYFLVNDLQKIEYMYQFSLKWYISIFEEELGEASDMTISDQDRLLDIIRNFTGKLFHKVSQSIFEKDKLLFIFMLAFRILEGERLLYTPLYEFFVKGPQAVIEIKTNQEVKKNSEKQE
jgi:dynein heavy chain, axonemal